MNAEHDNDSELEFLDLIRALLQKKLIISVSLFLFALAGIVYSLNLSNTYLATTVLIPNQEAGNSSLTGLASQFGGLANIAGINLGQRNSNKTLVAIQTLKSRKFIDGFIDRHLLAPHLIAVTGWDRETNSLIYDDDIFDVETNEWVGFDSDASVKEYPDKWALYKKFISLFDIHEDRESSVIRVTMEYYSPVLAREWLDRIINEINEYIREEDIAESNDNINFLIMELQKTDLTDMKEVFYQLIEEQTKSKMLAEVEKQYVFKIIDPPNVPNEKNGPKRAIIVLISAVFGFLFGALIAVYSTLKIKLKL
jgi:LPS O-antigen subunit length determinant protein (WzzB/FepE family)